TPRPILDGGHAPEGHAIQGKRGLRVQEIGQILVGAHGALGFGQGGGELVGACFVVGGDRLREQTGVALTQKLPTDRRWFWPAFGGGAGLLVILLAMICLWPSRHPLDRLRSDRIPAELRGKYLPEEVVAILGDARAQHSKNISAICVSTDGNTIATAGGGEIHISDAKTLKSTTVIPYEIAIYGLEFSPDGKKIIGACAHQLIQWDIASKKKDWIEDTSKNMAFGVYVTRAGKIISTRGDEKPVVRQSTSVNQVGTRQVFLCLA
ncbi:MAG: WD40 repeat domain-containing protein, partial [Planctomycetota bacterium]